jgi:hypothetical protein
VSITHTCRPPARCSLIALAIRCRTKIIPDHGPIFEGCCRPLTKPSVSTADAKAFSGVYSNTAVYAQMLMITNWRTPVQQMHEQHATHDAATAKSIRSLTPADDIAKPPISSLSDEEALCATFSRVFRRGLRPQKYKVRLVVWLAF